MVLKATMPPADTAPISLKATMPPADAPHRGSVNSAQTADFGCDELQADSVWQAPTAQQEPTAHKAVHFTSSTALGDFNMTPMASLASRGSVASCASVDDGERSSDGKSEIYMLDGNSETPVDAQGAPDGHDDIMDKMEKLMEMASKQLDSRASMFEPGDDFSRKTASRASRRGTMFNLGGRGSVASEVDGRRGSEITGLLDYLVEDFGLLNEADGLGDGSGSGSRSMLRISDVKALEEQLAQQTAATHMSRDEAMSLRAKLVEKDNDVAVLRASLDEKDAECEKLKADAAIFYKQYCEQAAWDAMEHTRQIQSLHDELESSRSHAKELSSKVQYEDAPARRVQAASSITSVGSSTGLFSPSHMPKVDMSKLSGSLMMAGGPQVGEYVSARRQPGTEPLLSARPAVLLSTQVPRVAPPQGGMEARATYPSESRATYSTPTPSSIHAAGSAASSTAARHGGASSPPNARRTPSPMGRYVPAPSPVAGSSLPLFGAQVAQQAPTTTFFSSRTVSPPPGYRSPPAVSRDLRKTSPGPGFRSTSPARATNIGLICATPHPPPRFPVAAGDHSPNIGGATLSANVPPAVALGNPSGSLRRTLSPSREADAQMPRSSNWHWKLKWSLERDES